MSKNLLVKFLSFIFQTVNLKSKIEKLALFFVVDVELTKKNSDHDVLLMQHETLMPKQIKK